MVDAEKINRMISTVRGKCEQLDDIQRKSLDKNLDITFEEHFSFQNLKSEAQVMELISADAAMIFYQALGQIHTDGNGGWAAGTDLATKAVTTQFMSEMLTKKINRSVKV